MEKKPYIGLVAFSFGLRWEEPSICNRRLAIEVWRIVLEEEKRGYCVLVVAQWEVAAALKKLPVPLAYIVERHHITGAYLDSREVMAQAADVFGQYSVREVVPVANPFVHLRYCRSLVREYGFIPMERVIRRIGFDKDSLQWWTRGPVRYAAYAAFRAIQTAL